MRRAGPEARRCARHRHAWAERPQVKTRSSSEDTGAEHPQVKASGSSADTGSGALKGAYASVWVGRAGPEARECGCTWGRHARIERPAVINFIPYTERHFNE